MPSRVSGSACTRSCSLHSSKAFASSSWLAWFIALSDGCRRAGRRPSNANPENGERVAPSACVKFLYGISAACVSRPPEIPAAGLAARTAQRLFWASSTGLVQTAENSREPMRPRNIMAVPMHNPRPSNAAGESQTDRQSRRTDRHQQPVADCGSTGRGVTSSSPAKRSRSAVRPAAVIGLMLPSWRRSPVARCRSSEWPKASHSFPSAIPPHRDA